MEGARSEYNIIVLGNYKLRKDEYKETSLKCVFVQLSEWARANPSRQMPSI